MPTDDDQPRIVVLGSTNMDLVTTAAALPEPGQTLLGNSFHTTPGGKGSNQAVAAARAGGRVEFIGAVGSDALGGELRDRLTAAGVGTDLLRTVPGPSGIAAITVDDDAENTIVVVPGANAELTTLTDGDLAALRGSALLMLQLEIPLAAVVAAATAASSAGAVVLLNPSPVQPLPPSLLSAVTVLVLNQGEADALGADAIRTVPHLVTTLGARGVHYRGPDGDEHTVPAPRVKAIDTTGAGDAFTGTLAVAWAAGDPPLIALEKACAAGAQATTVRGAGSG